ncbi:hypothetical protein MKJ01_17535 [Chryseobacterium sp. SSA4.19]|uniref:hypothetical protein n=1 Tax=Chryseobacterium sp. SSA4.19 TaxID=2919915 RepID=UPI001F4E39ED|nr:hypothetical protein [Chryseobacterium sp. SSA4.19]MCJ8155562.1 hypothetical protein [Chryseobacterium sp. SSA4.19]
MSATFPISDLSRELIFLSSWVEAKSSASVIPKTFAICSKVFTGESVFTLSSDIASERFTGNIAEVTGTTVQKTS